MFYGTEQELIAQLNRIESKLDQLLAQSSPQGGAQKQTPAPDSYAEVRASLANGRKIEAIKLYRELTGVGLKEAKEAVEAMMAAPSAAPVPSSNLDLEPVRALVANGKKIEAIRLYRELTGTGLKEAKEIIDAMPVTSSSW